jgi:hypothetical protein
MDSVKMSEEQYKKLKKLENKIIALIPICGLYTILKAFLDLIKECQNVNEIDEKIKHLENLVQIAENFIKNMNTCSQQNTKAIVAKPKPPVKKPPSPTQKDEQKQGKGKGR